MADQLQELIEVPREFLKEGLQFINKSQKREPPLSFRVPTQEPAGILPATTSIAPVIESTRAIDANPCAAADRREFIKISQVSRAVPAKQPAHPPAGTIAKGKSRERP